MHMSAEGKGSSPLPLSTFGSVFENQRNKYSKMASGGGDVLTDLWADFKMQKGVVKDVLSENSSSEEQLEEEFEEGEVEKEEEDKKTTPLLLHDTTKYALEERGRIYIGPENETLRLFEDSLWYPQFDFNSKSSYRVEMYERQILSDSRTRSKVDSLLGKTLVCVCPQKNGSCHGETLIKMVSKFLPITPFFITKSRGLFFKGAQCPLSNFFLSDMQDDNGKIFHSAAHMYAYKHLIFMGKTENAKLVLDMKSAYQAYAIMKEFISTKKTFSFREQIEEMAKVIRLKWDQCREFQSFIMNHEDFDFIEGTTSKFWGAGIDLPRVESNFQHYDVEGFNHLGWVIKFVAAEKMGKMSEWKKSISVMRTICQSSSKEKIPFVKGALNVDMYLRKKGQTRRKWRK